MFNFKKTILIFSAMCSTIHALLTEADIKLDTMKLVFKCNKDAQVAMSELIQLQNHVTPTKTETKCLLACTYKASGLMTKDGLYDLDYGYKIAEQIKDGDEKRLLNAKKIVDICVKVNEVSVSDGEKGCERAALIFQCTVENAPKFGFKLA